MANRSKLVVLKFLKSLVPVGFQRNASGINHTRTKEPGVEDVIISPHAGGRSPGVSAPIVEVGASVVVNSDLILVLLSAVNKNVWEETSEEELQKEEGLICVRCIWRWVHHGIYLPDLWGELEGGPVVSVFENFKDIAWENVVSEDAQRCTKVPGTNP